MSDPSTPEVAVEVNARKFDDLYERPNDLADFLAELFKEPGMVRCYRTDAENPSQQMQNKLGQAQDAIDGLLCLGLATDEAHQKAVESLASGWAANGKWSKNVSCVAFACPNPKSGRRQIRTIVEWRESPFPELIRTLLFPEAEVRAADGSPRARRVAKQPLPIHAPNVWMEIYNGEHAHGGEGWGLGQRLWSPTADKAKSRRYEQMQAVRPGDLVLHAVGGILTAFSYVRSRCVKDANGPPQPGAWAGMAPYYRVDLRDFSELPRAVPFDELYQRYGAFIRAELSSHLPEGVPADPEGTENGEDASYYPFCLRSGTDYGLRANQGMYLTRCTPALYQMLRECIDAADYTLADAQQGLFLEPQELRSILDQLARKKNVVVQGPPGVGKSHLARRAAWAFVGERGTRRVGYVQFHQSYSYEDFVQGWRPRAAGGFSLRNGAFHSFCAQAALDPTHRYVFIIDEINRGNMSKIFGELLTLIESDKRGPAFAMPLANADPAAGPREHFMVPENVHLLGLMNTADRSLSLVDYALRRRFAFVSLAPRFDSSTFRDHLSRAGVPEGLVRRIVERLGRLNDDIRQDPHLGPGFEVGHSYFTSPPDTDYEAWYAAIVRTELAPLVVEYWYDQPTTAETHIRELLGT